MRSEADPLGSAGRVGILYISRGGTDRDTTKSLSARDFSCLARILQNRSRTCHRSGKTKFLGWVALGLLAGSAGANAAGSALAAASSASSSTPVSNSTFIDYVFDVSGIFSVDPFGDPLNEVRSIDLGPNAHVIGTGWDVTLFADAPSWLSELRVMFGATSTPAIVQLTPGIGDNFPGTLSYTSGGVVDLVGLGLDYLVDADGQLRMEFFESFDDFPGDWDGIWESGTLTIRIESEDVEVPEPSIYGLLLLGLAGVATSSRRRTRQ